MTTRTQDALRRAPDGYVPPPVAAVEATPMIQFVAPDGSETPAGMRHGFDLALARDLYHRMSLARALDQEALALQRQGELSLWLQCWGQEAAQVGTARALPAETMVFPSYREHAAALCRGIEPAELLAQWRGISHSGWVADHRNFHFYSLVLGTQTLHATGFAMGNRLAGEASPVAVYFGDGAASQGDVSEAMNWAAAFRLPIIFICQNNQWAISTPTELQYGTPLHHRAAGFGLRSWHVDGNDALAVHAVTTAAVEWTAAGHGPAFVEADTFRMAGHSTSDDPKRYRSELEVEKWRGRDPLRRLDAALRHRGEGDWVDTVALQAREFAADVRRACLSLTAPAIEEVFEQVYTTPHPALREEQRAHAAFRAAVEAEAGHA
ncbi:thiamine pyrophosphate-dependent enzyme [Nocardioides humi]|uniref:2-oxoisovalerate dehydrogenase subunit alpha n=1 Tax=Nocardioides humi TaxID=449461 RepID=A0ABN2AT74_9ACTN|nr:thiamine pyrophosphate-dependent enzyme [Nocardioides humi]